MSSSPISSHPSWRSSPSQSSHYRGVQRGIVDPWLREEKKTQSFERTSELFSPPPPVSATTETPTRPVYDYKPTALKWWFNAALVAVLLTLTALTEYYLRLLPDDGLDYDLQRLADSFPNRHFPRLLSRVDNITAQATSLTPEDPKTIVVLPQAPAGAASVTPSATPALIMTPIISGQTTPLSTTTTGNRGSSSPTRTPKSSVQSSIVSTGSSHAPTAEGQTTQREPTIGLTSPRPGAEGQSSVGQYSESDRSSASNGEYQTPDKAVTSGEAPPTSTALCSACSGVFSTATSDYLSPGMMSSTMGTKTIIAGKETIVKNIVTSTFTTNAHVEPTASDIQSTAIVQQVTTQQQRTTIAQLVTTDLAGSTVSQAMLSIVPGATSTLRSAVVLHSGQSWVTTTGAIATSTQSSRTVLDTIAATNEDGGTITSIYLITIPPTTAVVTAIYGTVVAAGDPPPAPTSSSSASGSSDRNANSVVIVTGISRSRYLIGSFLPTLIAVMIAIPLRVIDANARLMQPFIALTAHPAGTTADASVFLRFHGWRKVLAAFPRAFKLRQPVVMAGQLLVAGAALLPPLAAEGVRVYVPDGCTGACEGSLRLDIASGRALQVLMVLLIVLLAAMMALLAWAKTGVRQNPWSIAGMAALGVNKEIRGLLKEVDRGVDGRIEDSELSRALARQKYALGSDGEQLQYGVRVTDFPVRLSEDLLKRSRSQAEKGFKNAAAARRAPNIPIYLLTLQGRILILLLFCAVLVLVLYCHNSWSTTDFEHFMNSERFGVRFLFAALGVASGFCMTAFFRRVAVLSPYLLMSQRALPAQRSILIAPATNPVSGLYSAIRQRHAYLGILAAATLLADFLPVTLSHVPFGLLETYQTQLTCAYLSIAVLVVMMLAVTASLAARWPHMPADPRTIAGVMYYLCDSSMLASFDGLAAVEMRDRDWMVKSMCVQYKFGTMTGISGKERVGIDIVGVTERDGGS